MDHFGLWRLYNVDCELGLYLQLIQWLSTNVYSLHPARPPLSLTHISSSPRDQRKPTYSLIIETTIALSNGAIADPLRLPFPPK